MGNLYRSLDGARERATQANSTGLPRLPHRGKGKASTPYDRHVALNRKISARNGVVQHDRLRFDLTSHIL
jgi:hypothetical protein